MIIPLEKLILNQGNIYKLTCAAIKRSNQLTLTGDEEVEKNNGKVVPTSISQILNKKVEYRIEE